jgi:hypothetical protein
MGVFQAVSMQHGRIPRILLPEDLAAASTNFDYPVQVPDVLALGASGSNTNQGWLPESAAAL